MQGNAMVAVCDVLGFGDYVKRHSLDEAVTYLRVIQDLAKNSMLRAYTPECIFRPKPTSHSGASRPLIPGHSVQ